MRGNYRELGAVNNDINLRKLLIAMASGPAVLIVLAERSDLPINTVLVLTRMLNGSMITSRDSGPNGATEFYLLPVSQWKF